MNTAALGRSRGVRKEEGARRTIGLRPQLRAEELESNEVESRSYGALWTECTD